MGENGHAVEYEGGKHRAEGPRGTGEGEPRARGMGSADSAPLRVTSEEVEEMATQAYGWISTVMEGRIAAEAEVWKLPLPASQTTGGTGGEAVQVPHIYSIISLLAWMVARSPSSLIPNCENETIEKELQEFYGDENVPMKDKKRIADLRKFLGIQFPQEAKDFPFAKAAMFFPFFRSYPEVVLGHLGLRVDDLRNFHGDIVEAYGEMRKRLDSRGFDGVANFPALGSWIARVGQMIEDMGFLKEFFGGAIPDGVKDVLRELSGFSSQQTPPPPAKREVVEAGQVRRSIEPRLHKATVTIWLSTLRALAGIPWNDSFDPLALAEAIPRGTLSPNRKVDGIAGLNLPFLPPEVQLKIKSVLAIVHLLGLLEEIAREVGQFPEVVYDPQKSFLKPGELEKIFNLILGIDPRSEAKVPTLVRGNGVEVKGWSGLEGDFVRDYRRIVVETLRRAAENTRRSAPFFIVPPDSRRKFLEKFRTMFGPSLREEEGYNKEILRASGLMERAFNGSFRDRVIGRFFRLLASGPLFHWGGRTGEFLGAIIHPRTLLALSIMNALSLVFAGRPFPIIPDFSPIIGRLFPGLMRPILFGGITWSKVVGIATGFFSLHVFSNVFLRGIFNSERFSRFLGFPRPSSNQEEASIASPLSTFVRANAGENSLEIIFHDIASEERRSLARIIGFLLIAMVVAASASRPPSFTGGIDVNRGVITVGPERKWGDLVIIGGENNEDITRIKKNIASLIFDIYKENTKGGMIIGNKDTLATYIRGTISGTNGYSQKEAEYLIKKLALDSKEGDDFVRKVNDIIKDDHLKDEEKELKLLELLENHMTTK
jgi:hypothetical protein